MNAVISSSQTISPKKLSKRLQLDPNREALFMSTYQKMTAQTPGGHSDLADEFKQFSAAKKAGVFEQNMIFKTSGSPKVHDMPENMLLTQDSQKDYKPGSKLEIDPK